MLNKQAIIDMAERIKAGESIRIPEELREAEREISRIRAEYVAKERVDHDRNMDFYTFLLQTLIKPSHEGVKVVIEEGLKRKFTKEQILDFLTMRLEDDRRGKKYIPKLEEM